MVASRLRGLLILAVAAGFAAEYYFQSKLLLGFIDDRNGAYAAVADDAKSMTEPAHVVVVPLWPGDSHYTSVYQHYVSLYRIRMINGYRPFVPREYIDSVFTPFRSINHGVLSDEQINDLLRRGIHHVILHEDLFPEKVSPFPVTTTLRNLLEHPRVTFLAQDGPVWSFRLEPAAVARTPLAHTWPYHFPARRLEAERQDINDGRKTDDPAASGGRFVTLSNGASVATSPLFAPMLPQLRWAIRARGQGELRVFSRAAGQTNELAAIQVASTNWQWVEAPLTPFALSQDVAVQARVPTGTVDVDVIKLWAGAWSSPAVGETLTIPGPCFFHAGAIDLSTDAVNFRPDRDRQDLILYGPKLPLEAGRYEISVLIESAATPGTLYGMWYMACPEGNEVGRMDLTAGGTNRTTIDVPSNLPFLMAFNYAGKIALNFKSVQITRVP